MENDLEKAKEIFLTGVDEETRQDNLEQITEWEKSISENRAFREWQDSDITKSIVVKARETYHEISLQLLGNRSLDQSAREKLWAKQDAMLFVLSLLAKDVEHEMEQIHFAIQKVINATK